MLSIRFKSFGLLVAGALTMAAAQWVRAGSLYTIDSGSDVYAQDSIGGVVTGASADASSGTASAATPSGTYYAMTSLASTNSSLTLTKTDARDNTAGDYSQSQWAINFTPTQTLNYSIAGTYEGVSGDSTETYNVFLTQAGNPLYSGQITNTESPLSLTSNVPITAGHLTGVLQAGVEYEYSGTSSVAPADPTGIGGDLGQGSDSISFTPASVPEPASLSLMDLGVLALVRRRRSKV